MVSQKNDVMIREVVESDLPTILSFYQDSETRFATGYDAPEESDLGTVQLQYHQATLDLNKVLWAVCLTETGQMVGVAEVWVGVPMPNAASIGLIIIGKEHRNRG